MYLACRNSHWGYIPYFIFACVNGVCVYACSHVYDSVCSVCVWRCPRLMLGAFLGCSLPLRLLRQLNSVEPRAHRYGWSTYPAFSKDLCFLPFFEHGHHRQTPTQTLHEFWKSKPSCPHTCVVSTLTTKPALIFYLLEIFLLYVRNYATQFAPYNSVKL